MKRPPSQSKGAIRKRRARAAAKLRASSTESAQAWKPTTPVAVPQEPAPVPSPLHETEPVQGPGADVFVMPPEPEPSSGAEARPFVEPEPPPPPPEPEPMPAGQADAIASAVVAFFQSGVQALFLRNPDLAARINVDKVQEVLPMVSALVHASAKQCAIKYNVRIPYQAELITAAAVGIACFGHWGTVRPPANDETAGPRIVRDVRDGVA